jgi:hypothetical protein
VRVALARDAKATTASPSILMQEVFRWQRRQAKRAGLREVRIGSVVFSQRFGSLLNLNIHHHAVVPDGVFTTSPRIAELTIGRVRGGQRHTHAARDLRPGAADGHAQAALALEGGSLHAPIQIGRPTRQV